MKLTNTIRDAFVRAAMNDVPQVDHDEAIRTIALEATLAAIPAPVRAVWDDPKTRDYVRAKTRWFAGVGVHVPSFGSGGWHDDDLPKISAKATKTLEDLGEKRDAQKKVREELERKLRGAAMSCSTRKALADLLPEFAKYLPADDAAANRTLPAIANIVADFAKAGWPKGKKPANAARSA